MPERSRAQSGKDAELQALNYLQQQGLRLLAQNWLCKRGELDLVMLDGDTVVFVEGRKRQKLILAAQFFLQEEHRWADAPCRFDVVAIESTPSGTADLNWLPNAFDS
jgi:putative endonuclease